LGSPETKDIIDFINEESSQDIEGADRESETNDGVGDPNAQNLFVLSVTLSNNKSFLVEVKKGWEPQ
jgi:hypothetical protein